MKNHLIVARPIAAAALLALSFTANASAADFPRIGSRGFNKPAQPQPTVVVSFRNASLENRELRIGAARFPLAPQKSILLQVGVGSDVRVWSNQNSHVNGQSVGTITPSMDHSSIALR